MADTREEPEQEMFLVGDEDGAVNIQCRRKGCEVPRPKTSLSHLRESQSVWLEIEVPYSATPLDVDRIWHQHRVDHANK